MSDIQKIPFSPPDITQEEIDEVVDTLRSGWITTGPKTKLFEKQLAEYCHTSTVCCLSSATAALELCLILLGIGPGDEVITSAYTYTASCSPIIHVGATPVLVDVAPGSFHIDYGKIGKAITSRTKAVIPVDIGGVMCDYDTLYQVLEDYKSKYSPNNEIQALFDRVIVISDAAHSIGATYKGKMSGQLGDFTAFGMTMWIRLIGWLCFFIWACLDGVDGNLARCTNQCSSLGDLWDTMGGYAAMVLILFGSGIAAFFDKNSIELLENYWYLIIGGATAIFSIFPRLIMHKKKSSELNSDAVKGLSDKKSFGLVKITAMNLVSPSGFMQVILLLCIILNFTNFFIVFYFFVTFGVMSLSLYKLLRA